MNRNLKALGLALVAAFALGAIVAQGALAAEEHEFVFGESPTVLTGAQESGEGHHTLSIGETSFTCEAITFSGVVMGTETDDLALQPHYTVCDENLGKTSVSIDLNGCYYTIDSDTTENPSTEGVEDAPIDIVCPAEKEITITVSECIVHIPPQEGLHGITAESIEEGGKEAITLSMTIDSVTATSTGGFACLVFGVGGSEKTHSATYVGKTIVTGYVQEETCENGQVDVALAGTAK